MVSDATVDSEQSYARFLKFKEFVGFDQKDAETLGRLGPVLVPEQARITDAFYEAILHEPETRAFVEGRIDTLKRTHSAWFGELFEGQYQRAYFDRRWRIGLAHVRIGLDSRWVDVVCTHIHELVLATLSDLLGSEGVVAHRSFARLLELDRAVIQLAYDEDRLSRLSEFTGMKRALIENVVRIAR